MTVTRLRPWRAPPVADPVAFLVAALVAVSLSLIAAPAARAADYTLRFAHFWSSAAPFHKDFFVPWAKSIEAESDGRISVEVYPAQTLSKAPASYEAVKSRIADATATIQAYMPGRFPLTQIIELPGVGQNAVQASCTVQTLYDEGVLADEYKDTHVLFLFGHGSGEIHTKDKLIKTPDDLAGLRIRRPTTVLGEMLDRIGAQPVGLQGPETYQALQRNVVDGTMMPYEALRAFRLEEVTHYHTETQGLYTLAFVVTMNKTVYDSLPDDLKKVIDDHSGLTWSIKAGELFEKGDAAAKAKAEADGHDFYVIPDGVAENPAWKPVIQATIGGYLADLKEQGLPARKVYDEALRVAKACE